MACSREVSIENVNGEAVQLSESIFIYANKKLTEHGNVFEGEVRSGVYGIRPCAIKFPQKFEDNVREAKILTKLGSHTHVISIIQSGVHRDSFEEHVYLALDKCHKQNLRQYFEHRKESGLVYDVNVGLEYSKQIIAGVTYVHENLIFHKDLKPSNILLTLDRSTIKLADFGMSQELKSTSSTVFCTHQFGTNGFRPPESFGNSWASMKSDIYSLGVVFYFALSNGESPFGNDFHLRVFNANNGVSDLSSLLVPNPKATEHLLKLMMSQERCRRPSIWQVAAHPCWTNNEVGCDFDYGCEEEIDDSKVKIPEPSIQEPDDSETEKERIHEFLRAVKEFGYGRSPVLETSIIIFDKNSQHLQRFNPRNINVTPIVEYNDKMKRKLFSSVFVNGNIYVLMERSMYRLKRGDASPAWEPMADLIADHGLQPPAVVASGMIILAGATILAGSTHIKSVTKYDPSKDRWEKLKDKQLATDYSANVHSQGYVYCTGGKIGDGFQRPYYPTDRVERLKVISQSWDEVASMHQPKWGASAADCDGKIIVAGGRTIDGQETSSVEKYDPDENQWTTMKPMMVERFSPSFRCHFIEGNIFAVGAFSKGIEKYDFEKDDWTVVKLPSEAEFNILESVLVTATRIQQEK